MKCPACADATLVMSDRQGVEIDYCPACRGVWLDRGELDKLIERSGSNQPAAPHPAAAHGNPRSRPDFADSDHGHDQSRGPGGARKKNWLSNIFD